MSLDVYLISEKPITKSSSGIFIRENAQTKEVTMQRWNELHGNAVPVMIPPETSETTTFFYYNITHNLGTMANAAAIYMALWRPEEIGITLASQLIEPLRDGLNKLKSNPEKYKEFNPDNGWGDYDGLLAFVEAYLNACYEYPDAKIEVSR